MSSSIIKTFFIRSILMAGIIFLSFSMSVSSETPGIPPDLMKWKPWVLYGMEEKLCPPNYNDGRIRRCNWPSRLKLVIETEKGYFTQQWLVFAKGWVPLPGGTEAWPQEVELDGKNVPVVKRNNIPHILMLSGEHEVKGTFKFIKMPEMIRVPAAAGLVDLFIKGQKIDFPIFDKNGRLWLERRDYVKKQEESMRVSIYRLLDDTIPMKVTNHLEIDIAGQAREIKLDGVLLEKSVPMSLKSPLPSRIGPKGELLIQARPGRWKIDIITRLKEQVKEIGPVKGIYGKEIWSFKPEHHLRMVKITGVLSVDPGQAGAPSDWKKYPAYIVKPESVIYFKEIKRGDPDPAPDRLNLHRTWWLDFNGNGFTINDRITGTMSRRWRLSMNPPTVLGRVAIDGKNQLITVHDESNKAGVELRHGKINLTADSRFAESAGLIPATGWDHNFESVSGVLNLPPGWRILTAYGADVLPGTWFQRWTLLDFFLVLIICIAVFKIKNFIWGILALATMILIYHEPGSPRLVWLNILAASALLRVLPAGWAKRLVTLWNLIAVVVLLVISIPFIVEQIRCGIYPQLDRPDIIVQHKSPPQIYEERASGIIQETKKDKIIKRLSKINLAKTYPGSSMARKQETDVYSRQPVVFTHDPNALIQTGPGLPSWQWKSVKVKWNGPVDKSQHIRLYLLSPVVNLVVAFARVIFLALLISGLINLRYWLKSANKKIKKTVPAFALLLLLPVISKAETQTAYYPPPELLQQLQNRFLKQPDCLPHCADCAFLELKATPESLNIMFEVHAACRTAIPLPVASESWIPDEIFLDNEPLKGILKESDGILWALVPKGIYKIRLTGKTAGIDSIQIPLPLTPQRAIVTSNGWDVRGVNQNGKVESSIQLTRIKKDGLNRLTDERNVLSPFFHVKRVLHLGLTWKISTTIKRLTPLDLPVVVSIPLIKGESVTTSGIHIENGDAIINMNSGTDEVYWHSNLEMTPEIRLAAPQSVPWTETWALDASPVWHCEIFGINVIHHQDIQGLYRPQWQPWSGEEVIIKISQPKAVSGRMVTIDKADLVLTPGKRFNKAELTLKIRTSLGGQQEIILPDDADLQLVKIDNKSRPIRQKGDKVIIPLHPGSQNLYIQWHQLTQSLLLFKSPLVIIGNEAVNAGVTINMPKNRWLLFTCGPRLGPAVLFWSYLVIVIIAAFALGRFNMTPLKTHTWLLLSLGLTQVSPFIAILIAGWLIALGLRKKHIPSGNWFYFNTVQLILVIWTMAALSGLYTAIEKGLLGIPDMQVSGNFSSSLYLHWTQDRIDSVMPQPIVLSLPQFIYHLLMLIWALWLAFSLLKWIKWGWESFSEDQIWKKVPWRRKKKA